MSTELRSLLVELAQDADEWETPDPATQAARAWSAGRSQRGRARLLIALAAAAVLLLAWPVGAWLVGPSGPLRPDPPASDAAAQGLRLPERIARADPLTADTGAGTTLREYAGPVAAIVWPRAYEPLALGADGAFRRFDTSEPSARAAWASVSPDGTRVAWVTCRTDQSAAGPADPDCEPDELHVRNLRSDPPGRSSVVDLAELRWGQESATLDSRVLRWSPSGELLLIGASPVGSSGVAPVRAVVVDDSGRVTPVHSIHEIAGWRDEAHVVSWDLTGSATDDPNSGSALRLRAIQLRTDATTPLVDLTPADAPGPDPVQVLAPVVMSVDGDLVTAAGSTVHQFVWRVDGRQVATHRRLDDRALRTLPARAGFVEWTAQRCLADAGTGRCRIAVDPRLAARQPAIATEALDRPLIQSWLGTRTSLVFWYWPWAAAAVLAVTVVAGWLVIREKRRSQARRRPAEAPGA